MVTGSSSGIGRAIAIRLAEMGANLIVHGRSMSVALGETIASIEDTGAVAYSVLADFESCDDFESFVEGAWNAAGAIDIWVNNAGGDVLTGDKADDTLDEKLNYLWRVDVRATWFLYREIGWRMKAARNNPSEIQSSSSSIINIGWDQAANGMAGDSGELFSITKGAIMSMSKSLAQSLAPEVRVNCVAPGWIQTEWGEQASDFWNDRAVQEALMNRWGKPDDIADAVAFLAGNQSSFITGQILPVNGGFQFDQSTHTKQG